MVEPNQTLLSNPLVINGILPFLLVFAVVFAVLQKSKILGDGKRQLDAVVAAVVGLILVSFAYATGIIVSLVPFLAVSVVILLVFLILYSMIFQGEDSKKFGLPNGLKLGLGIIIIVAVAAAVLVATGAWEYLSGYLTGGNTSAVVANVVFVIILVGAIVAVTWKSKETKG